MKTFHTRVIVLAICTASITSAQAHDSISFGLNIGSYGYAPPVVYYSEPVMYYQPSPRYYSYAPAMSFGYQNYGFRGHHGGWGHEAREHHGWGHGGEERGHRGHD